MLRYCVAAVLTIIFLTSGSVMMARAAVIDFSATGQPDDVDCATVENVSYCDPHKWLYELVADYLVLSDYDFFEDLDFRAAPGTTFTPKSIDITAYSDVWRMYCDEICRSTEYLRSYYEDMMGQRDLWERVSLNYLGILGGRSYLTPIFDPSGMTRIVFGKEYEDISYLSFFLAEFGYWLDWYEPVIEPDGYLYACGFYSSGACFFMTFDNLVFEPNTQAPAPAPVPLPPAAPMLAGALAVIGWVRRRRRSVGQDAV